MLYTSARLRMHAVHTSPAHTCLQTYTAYLASAEWRSSRTYRSSQTNAGYVFSDRDPYGAAIL